jgi:hypothetical protein
VSGSAGGHRRGRVGERSEAGEGAGVHRGSKRGYGGGSFARGHTVGRLPRRACAGRGGGYMGSTVADKWGP